VRTRENRYTFIFFISLNVLIVFYSYFSDFMNTHIQTTQYRDQGLTPEIPRECPAKLAQLMKMCWNKDPNQRPVSSLSIFFSISIFSNCVFVLICETHTHTHTHTHSERSEMSLSLTHFLFSVDCCVP
jgi:hypothetical protein